MLFQVIGACRLTALMRAERLRELDTSWLLFGPEGEGAAAEPEAKAPPAWRYAAE